MKQVITTIVVAVAIGILREKLTVPFRFVHLQMQPADATLLMPVEGISVRPGCGHLVRPPARQPQAPGSGYLRPERNTCAFRD